MGIEVFLLETGEMVEQHTSVNLPNYLEEVLDRESTSHINYSLLSLS